MSNVNEYREEEVIEDEEYTQFVQRGNEDFVPEDEDEAKPDTPELQHELREASVHPKEGQYAEDESLMETEEPLYGKDDTGRGSESADRRIASLVAASHRKNRPPEAKRESALKASKLEEEVTGEPLEINEQGEVVVEE
jgi:hypothetical protein